MAVYDRFGRLAFGSPTLPKTVIEYVIFERYLNNIYGQWRVHDKIIPEWAPPPTPIIRSYPLPKLFKVDEDALKKLESKFKKDDDSNLPAERQTA
jgi:large subunit ribosomal protein L45